jgi:hypothetical protein
MFQSLQCMMIICLIYSGCETNEQWKVGGHQFYSCRKLLLGLQCKIICFIDSA